MKKYLIFLLLVSMLLSCQSQEEKERLFNEKVMQEKMKFKQAEEAKKGLEEKRKEEQILKNKQSEEERKKQEELLSDSLILETVSLNKEALALLGEQGGGASSSGGEFDLESDASVTKFINNVISFNNPQYVPDDLVDIRGDFINDLKGNSQIREIVLTKLDDMSQDFYLQFKEKIILVSAYRSYAYQKGIKDRGCADLFCAKAGFSEHQSGLAIDLWEASSQELFNKNERHRQYFDWMNQKAHLYGFTNTYQKGVETDGYAIEPWHWRYVGEDLAMLLKENDLTFAEYYYNKDNF